MTRGLKCVGLDQKGNIVPEKAWPSGRQKNRGKAIRYRRRNEP